MEPNKPPLPSNPEELAAAAAREDWTAVDAAISAGVAEGDDYLSWAKDHLGSEDDKERDLAATLYERTSRDLSDRTKAELEAHMETDDSRFVRYRSAFALFTHPDKSPPSSLFHDKLPGIIRVIREAADDEDEDVSAVAQDYLSQLDQDER